MTDREIDLIQGTLNILVLRALSWTPMNGYAIGRWIRETTRDALTVQEGALYPALHRLEKRGLLSEEWRVTETGREAKFYALTPAGRVQLRAELERWTRFSQAVTTALTATTA